MFRLHWAVFAASIRGRTMQRNETATEVDRDSEWSEAGQSALKQDKQAQESFLRK
jgi:hypothetical protein